MKKNVNPEKNDPPIPITFVEAVLFRPRMYTLSGTFEEIIAFLEGYFSGIAKGNPYAPPVVEWTAFHLWLADRMRLSSEEVFSTLRASSIDNQVLLEKLLELFQQFRDEKAELAQPELATASR